MKQITERQTSVLLVIAVLLLAANSLFWQFSEKGQSDFEDENIPILYHKDLRIPAADMRIIISENSCSCIEGHFLILNPGRKKTPGSGITVRKRCGDMAEGFPLTDRYTVESAWGMI